MRALKHSPSAPFIGFWVLGIVSTSPGEMKGTPRQSLIPLICPGKGGDPEPGQTGTQPQKGVDLVWARGGAGCGL